MAVMVSTKEYKVGDTFFIEGVEWVVTKIEGYEIHHEKVRKM